MINQDKQNYEIKELKNETVTASRIQGTGWVIYSVQTITVTAENITNIEERIIEIKEATEK